MSAFVIGELTGTWRVTHSTFPMWLSGKKTRPSFTYTPDRGGTVLLDDVSYVEGGKEKHILGVDTPVPGDDTAFVWRGRGLLKPLTSRWRVETFEKTWAVISFQPTLFTPAGVDIIARGALDDGSMESARTAIARAPHLALWVEKLQPTTW